MKKLWILLLCLCLTIPSIGVTLVPTALADTGYILAEIPYRADAFGTMSNGSFVQAMEFEPIDLTEFGYPADGNEAAENTLGISFDIYVNGVDESGAAVTPWGFAGQLELTSSGTCDKNELYCSTGSWMATPGAWKRQVIDLYDFGNNGGAFDPKNLNYMRLYFSLNFGQTVEYRVKIVNVRIVDLTKSAPPVSQNPIGEAILTALEVPDFTHYPAPAGFEDEKLVAGYNLAAYTQKYAAQLGEITDYSPIIQSLLDELSLAGGGNLYIPSGHYPCRTPITLRAGVSIYGDWRVPDGESAIAGTILDVYHGEGSLGGIPFISLSSESMVKNLAFWYPEQDVNNIKPYSPTVSLAGWAWAKNCTFVNSCMAVKQGPTFVNCPNAQGIYGTPLTCGMDLGYAIDIMRIEGVDFAADYWIHSGLAGAPSSEADAAALRGHLYQNATGVRVGRIDWSYLTYVTVDGYQKGVVFANHSSGVPNGQCHNLTLRNCYVGLDVERLGTTGEMVSNSTFQNCVYGVLVRPADTVSDGAILHLINVDIDATEYAVYHRQTMMVQLLSSRVQSGIVAADDGWYTVVDTTFDTAAPQIVLQSGTLSAVLSGNTTATGGAIEVSNLAGCVVSQENAAVSVADVVTVTEAEGREQKKGPTVGNLYVIEDLDTTGQTDVTNALQQKLNAAAAAGGGVVYLANGHYRLEGQITVPTNVELRGANDFGRIPYNSGAVLDLYAYAGETDPTSHTHEHAQVSLQNLVSQNDTAYANAGFTEVKSANGLVTVKDFNGGYFHNNYPVAGGCYKTAVSSWNTQFFNLDVSAFVEDAGTDDLVIWVKAKPQTDWAQNYIVAGATNTWSGYPFYTNAAHGAASSALGTLNTGAWTWYKFTLNDVTSRLQNIIPIGGTGTNNEPIYFSDVIVCAEGSTGEPVIGSEPSIVLQSGSGLRGLTIWYPEQAHSETFMTDHQFTEYPYAIQGRGSDLWVVNVAIRNGWNGLDMASYACDNHYVDYLAGACLNTFIHVGGGSQNGIIRNYQVKAGTFISEADMGGWSSGALPENMGNIVYTHMQNNMTVLKVGDVDNQLLYDNFNYGGYQGVLFEAEASGAADARMIGCAMDYTTVCVDVQSAESLDILNLQMVSYNYPNAIGDPANLTKDMHFIRLGAQNTASVNVAGLIFWDNPTWCVKVEGGTLNLYGLNYLTTHTNFASVSTNGTVNVVAPYLKRTDLVLATANHGRVHLSAGYYRALPDGYALAGTFRQMLQASEVPSTTANYAYSLDFTSGVRVNGSGLTQGFTNPDGGTAGTDDGFAVREGVIGFGPTSNAVWERYYMSVNNAARYYDSAYTSFRTTFRVTMKYYDPGTGSGSVGFAYANGNTEKVRSVATGGTSAGWHTATFVIEDAKFSYGTALNTRDIRAYFGANSAGWLMAYVIVEPLTYGAVDYNGTAASVNDLASYDAAYAANAAFADPAGGTSAVRNASTAYDGAEAFMAKVTYDAQKLGVSGSDGVTVLVSYYTEGNAIWNYMSIGQEVNHNISAQETYRGNIVTGNSCVYYDQYATGRWAVARCDFAHNYLNGAVSIRTKNYGGKSFYIGRIVVVPTTALDGNTSYASVLFGEAAAENAYFERSAHPVTEQVKTQKANAVANPAASYVEFEGCGALKFAASATQNQTIATVRLTPAYDSSLFATGATVMVTYYLDGSDPTAADTLKLANKDKTVKATHTVSATGDTGWQTANFEISAADYARGVFKLVSGNTSRDLYVSSIVIIPSA